MGVIITLSDLNKEVLFVDLFILFKLIHAILDLLYHPHNLTKLIVNEHIPSIETRLNDWH